MNNETKILGPVFGVLILVLILVLLKSANILKPINLSGTDAVPTIALTVEEKSEIKKEEDSLKDSGKKPTDSELKKLVSDYGPCRDVPILMYQHLSKNTFTAQMEYLTNNGYTAVTLAELLVGLKGGILPYRPVVLTFDNGYLDYYTDAYPVLKQKNLKSVIFISSQNIGKTNFMSSNQIKEVFGSGLVTLGNHGGTHLDLTTLDKNKVAEEVVDSNSYFERSLGTKAEVFSYPYGKYNATVTDVLKSNGYIAAVTVKSGPSCAKLPFELPRIPIGDKGMSSYGL